ncbi:MAG TPA: hypothetical protein VFD30_23010 [Terriglobia bacterium]|jgi:hypothetical protein|nr:hypothetical protein [Terriglobia bacterium]
MTTRYQAQFAKPLVNQLIAILQRDQQAALDIVNGTRPASRALKPFAAFHKEAAPVQSWPALVLVAQEIRFDLNSDADLRTQTLRFFCAMAITGTDPEWLAEDAMDYLRAVDIVLSSVPLADFTTPLAISHRTVPGGMTTGLDPANTKLLDLRVVRHDLGALVSRRGGALARGPQIEFVVDLEER